MTSHKEGVIFFVTQVLKARAKEGDRGCQGGHLTPRFCEVVGALVPKCVKSY